MDTVAAKTKAYELMKNRKFYTDGELGSLLYHGERVAIICHNLRTKIFPNDISWDSVLYVCGLFHDIGKGYHPHNEYSAEITRHALKNICEDSELNLICYIIEYHSIRDSVNASYSNQLKVFQDADIIDRFGSLTLWVDFHRSAYLEKTIQETISSHDESWSDFCATYTNLANFEETRRVMEKRITFVNDFYNKLKLDNSGYIG